MPYDSDALTERQLELLSYVASGLTIGQAAQQVHLAERSAYNILSLARSNVGAKTVPQLITIAIQNGMLIADGEGSVTPAASDD